MAEISLNPVDRVEILSIMDNSIDVLMAGTPIAKRAPLLRDKFSRPLSKRESTIAALKLPLAQVLSVDPDHFLQAPALVHRLPVLSC